MRLTHAETMPGRCLSRTKRVAVSKKIPWPSAMKHWLQLLQRQSFILHGAGYLQLPPAPKGAEDTRCCALGSWAPVGFRMVPAPAQDAAGASAQHRRLCARVPACVGARPRPRPGPHASVSMVLMERLKSASEVCLVQKASHARKCFCGVVILIKHPAVPCSISATEACWQCPAHQTAKGRW